MKIFQAGIGLFDMQHWNDMLPFFPFLYAEMHYTLKRFSLIHRAWPELIADAPHRVEPDHDIPLLLLVKDAHRYPCVLDHAHALIRYPDGKETLLPLIEKSVSLNQHWWTSLHTIRPREGFFGTLSIDVALHVYRDDDTRIRVFHNDNYKGTRHRPLSVFVAEEPLPRFKNWHFGDLHVHSSFTSGQTEFGAPVDAIAAMAEAAGLSFAAVTDHSYDLDDREDDYLTNDPGLPKWKAMHASVEKMEKEGRFTCIPGEEVSCRNALSMNVHLLLLNNRRFVPGSGDGAERWLRTRSEQSVAEILDDLEEGVLAFAAHPEVPFPPLHWLLFRRWKWTMRDYRHPGLSGLEILNGGEYFFYRRGLKKWIRLLLEGRKVFIIAGNDAHGNFNRFRQLRLPFLAFRENDSHVFGKDRTAVIVHGKPTKESVLSALGKGRCAITNGPVLNLELVNEKGRKAAIGDTIPGRRFRIHIEARSTEEFGKLKILKVWQGVVGQKKENLIKKTSLDNLYELSDDFILETHTSAAYIRTEVMTRKKSATFFCLTNPIWIEKRM